MNFSRGDTASNCAFFIAVGGAVFFPQEEDKMQTQLLLKFFKVKTKTILLMIYKSGCYMMCFVQERDNGERPMDCFLL